MIEQAQKQGKIHKDTILVEPTSGNQGVGLALVGAVKGYKTIIIMPDSVSEERRKLVKQYGAEVILVGDIGDCIQACVAKAKQLACQEGLLCGISSGSNVAAALKLAKKLGKGNTVVTILPDTAERYYSTPLFDSD